MPRWLWDDTGTFAGKSSSHGSLARVGGDFLKLAEKKPPRQPQSHLPKGSTRNQSNTTVLITSLIQMMIIDLEIMAATTTKILLTIYAQK